MDPRFGVVQPAGQVAGMFTDIGDGRGDPLLDPPALRGRGGVRVDPGDQFVQQAELGVLPDVVGHREDGFAEFVELFDRPPRDARRRLLPHRMDDDPGIVQRQQAMGLSAVREEAPR